MPPQVDSTPPPSLAEQHARFYGAMLAARAAGLEKFVLGIVTEPATAHPLFVSTRGLPTSGSGSPAAQCAEIGATEYQDFVASRRPLTV